MDRSREVVTDKQRYNPFNKSLGRDESKASLISRIQPLQEREHDDILSKFQKKDDILDNSQVGGESVVNARSIVESPAFTRAPSLHTEEKYFLKQRIAELKNELRYYKQTVQVQAKALKDKSKEYNDDLIESLRSELSHEKKLRLEQKAQLVKAQ